MANNSSRIPAGYEPISMWGYFGYEILFAIPIIGWIFLIVFALTAENQNLRNFARSQFCVFIIWLVFMGVALASGLLVAMFQSLS